jgi:nicotinamidase-related amidase
MTTTDLETSYSTAGFCGSFHLGRCPALVVVDLTLGFTDPDAPLGADLDTCVEHTAALASTVREAGGSVFFTTLTFEPSLADAGVWIQKVPGLATLVDGTDATRVDPRLGPLAGDCVIRKRGASAFFGTGLASLLATRSTDSVIVAGATTSGCVRATVVDAVQHGYPVFVPIECVGDRASGPHDANLFDMASKYADVVPLQQLTDALHTRRAGDNANHHPAQLQETP